MLAGRCLRRMGSSILRNWLRLQRSVQLCYRFEFTQGKTLASKSEPKQNRQRILLSTDFYRKAAEM